MIRIIFIHPSPRMFFLFFFPFPIIIGIEAANKKSAARFNVLGSSSEICASKSHYITVVIFHRRSSSSSPPRKIEPRPTIYDENALCLTRILAIPHTRTHTPPTFRIVWYFFFHLGNYINTNKNLRVRISPSPFSGRDSAKGEEKKYPWTIENVIVHFMRESTPSWGKDILTWKSCNAIPSLFKVNRE